MVFGGFLETIFQPFAPPLQGLINGLWRRGQTPLEDGQRKADGPLSSAMIKFFGAVKLTADVFGHMPIQIRLVARKLIIDGIGLAFGEQRLAVKF